MYSSSSVYITAGVSQVSFYLGVILACESHKGCDNNLQLVNKVEQNIVICQ